MEAREVQKSHQVEWDGRKRQQGPEWMGDTIQVPGHTLPGTSVQESEP